MQELRLVAVSEDGTYLVLASPGRGTRFSLPIDQRLRAAIRGQPSRLDQLQIEVESPLRPKEIQARIRAGETADDIAESAGVPVERIRWFEGPVLQERGYMAQQAQRTPIRHPGESTPGPPLGELVAERLSARGVNADDAQWDSWKREDRTWKIRLHFQIASRSCSAEWIFDPIRRHVSPVDEEAARLSAPDVLPEDSVTPLVPRIAPAPSQVATPESGPEAVLEPLRSTESSPASQEPDSTQEPPAETEEPPAASAGNARPTPAPKRTRRSGSGRSRRASVPSWDEIMFSTHRRPD